MKVELDEAMIASLGRSREVIEALVAEAEAIAAEARRIARSEFYRTGAYAAGIRAKPVGLPNGKIAGQVQATDYKSTWAEFGWTQNGQHHPPKAILRHAAESLGLHPIPLPKP